MSIIDNHIGETRTMNCRMKATIIEYRKYNDIDVQFDDGVVVYNCSYYNFSRGIIANPSLGRNFAQKKINRIGEKRIMNNGLEAEILHYNSATDIDVKFEDNTIVRHKSYDHFLHGKIAKPIIDHIGEKSQMKCGMDATIVAYRKSSDIDVLFEDGTLVENRGYGEFRKGEIANPSLGKFASVSYKFRTRVGESQVMNNGMQARIIDYQKHNNITVEFEDGTIVENTSYSLFISGGISNPNFIISGESLFEGVILYYLSRHGFSHFKAKDMMKNGFGKYEIDIFNPNTSDGIEIDGVFHDLEKDIKKNSMFFSDHHKKLIRIRDISLPELNDDKSIVFYIDMNKRAFSQEYESIIKMVFTLLKIQNNVDLQKDKEAISTFYYRIHSNKRIGEKRIMNCGMEATIIAYRRSDDIDVRFVDGSIVKNKSYKSFIKGEILNPIFQIEKRIGETRMMNCGMNATIIAYRNARNIDIQFEDGTVIQSREYNRFLHGKINNPNLFQSKHIGEKEMMNCGMKVTIVAYRRSDDIDVEFEDGYISTEKTYKSFLKGAISNPNCSDSMKRIGETRMMNCGQKATIIAYYNSENIDIEFEDGSVALKKSYGNFKSGSIKHPLFGKNTAITYRQKIERIGEHRIMNCGMEATIIEYRTFKDIDVCFSDGTIVKNRTYNQFCNGTIAHPRNEIVSAKLKV